VRTFPLLSGFRPIGMTLLLFPRPCKNRLEHRRAGRRGRISHSRKVTPVCARIQKVNGPAVLDLGDRTFLGPMSMTNRNMCRPDPGTAPGGKNLCTRGGPIAHLRTAASPWCRRHHKGFHAPDEQTGRSPMGQTGTPDLESGLNWSRALGTRAVLRV